MHSELKELLEIFTKNKEAGSDDWKNFLQHRAYLEEQANLNDLELLYFLVDHVNNLPLEAHPDIYGCLLRLSSEHYALAQIYAEHFKAIYKKNIGEFKTAKQVSAYVILIMLAQEALTQVCRQQSIEIELFNQFVPLTERAQTHGYLFNLLGWMHYYGVGTMVHVERAMDCFKQGARLNCVAAEFSLADCSKESRNDRGNEFDYLIAAAKNGHTDAQYLVAEKLYSFGCKLSRGQNDKAQETFNRACDWLRIAANQGHSNAQYRLGFCYDKSKGVSRDVVKASFYFSQAAKQGHVNAINCLANFYLNGIGVIKDYQKAISLYQRARLQGNEYAALRLIDLYFESNDEDEAIAIFEELTAINGHFGAEETLQKYADKKQSAKIMYALGKLYGRSKGIKPEEPLVNGRPAYRNENSTYSSWCEDQMISWYKKAALLGHVEAKKHKTAYYQRQAKTLINYIPSQTCPSNFFPQSLSPEPSNAPGTLTVVKTDRGQQP